MKKVNITEALKSHNLDDAEKSIMDGVSKEVNEALEDALKGKISADEAKKAIEDAIKGLPETHSAKSIIMPGTAPEGGTDKTLDEMMRDAMKEVAEVKKALSGGASSKIETLESVIDKNWGEIERVFKAKAGHVTISMKAAVVMSTANTIDVSELNPETFGAEKIEDRGLILRRRNREYIFDIADRQIVADLPEVIRWDEEGDEQGAFAIVGEGQVKPLLSLSLVRNESEKQKAAGKIVVTEELMKFRPRLMARIRTLFNRKVVRDYENILTTNLLAQAASYVGTSLDDTVTTPNDYDAIGAVAAQLETLNFAPDVLIINPQDKWRIALTKDSEGRYVTTLPITGANGQIQFMTFRTVTTNKIAAGTAILGEGDLWKIEQENITMRMGYGLTMNGSTPEADFDHNRMRIIAELFFHNYISSIDAGSFVRFQFATVKAALLKP